MGCTGASSGYFQPADVHVVCGRGRVAVFVRTEPGVEGPGCKPPEPLAPQKLSFTRERLEAEAYNSAHLDNRRRVEVEALQACRGKEEIDFCQCSMMNTTSNTTLLEQYEQMNTSYNTTLLQQYEQMNTSYNTTLLEQYEHHLKHHPLRASSNYEQMNTTYNTTLLQQYDQMNTTLLQQYDQMNTTLLQQYDQMNTTLTGFVSIPVPWGGLEKGFALAALDRGHSSSP
ncbi:unnamed protein product [Boreogadus saida]